MELVDGAVRVLACLEHVAAGRLDHGLRGLLALLREDPCDPALLHAVALTTLQAGDLDASERFLVRAIEAAHQRDDQTRAATYREDAVHIIGELARRHEGLAELTAAEAAYRRLVTFVPTHADAWTRIATIALAHGDLAATAVALRSLDALTTERPELLVLQAEHAALSGDAQRALSLLRAALERAPDHAEAGLLLATLLERRGNWVEAKDQLQHTASVNPAIRAVQFAHARLLAGSAGSAARAARDALRVAQALEAANDADREPIERMIRAGTFAEADQLIEQRLARNPCDINAVELRARLFEQQQQPERAAYWFARTHQLDPSQPIAAIRWAFRLENLGASDAAAHVLDRVLLRWPRFGAARIRRALVQPPVAPDAATLARVRSDLTDGIASLRRDLPAFDAQEVSLLSSNFWLAYQGGDDRNLQIELARMYVEACPALAFTAAHVKRRTTRPRLRIGLLSAFFSQHIVSRLYRGVIERLDRQRFEVILIHSADGRRDAVTAELNAMADGAVNLPAGLPASQQTLAALELDILFYPDVGMSHDNYFRAFGRYARVQCTSWGHPITTGLPAMDYFISSSRLEHPLADTHYSERLVRFADLPTSLAPLEVPAPFDRAALGLSARQPVYACLQTLFKFHPTFDLALAGIVRADPRATILAISDADDHWSSMLRERWVRTMPEVAQRVRFLPRMTHAAFLGVLAAADVALDTYPFAGGNTTLQSIGVGTPLITLPTDFMRGRCGLGAYDQIGFTDLVARDSAHYVELAVRTANDRAFRTDCVRAIRNGAPRLFNTSTVIDEFNEFFAAAYTSSERPQ